MRVPLPSLPSALRANPMTSQLFDMAPVASPVTLQFLREQIIENCGFPNVPHAKIYLVLAKEPLGNFKAIAVKAENGRREALLSETGGTVQDALQLLLNRSAEAVQHHISTHGFDFVPENDDDDDDDDDDISDSEFSVHIREDSADESLSDNETVSVASTARVPNLSRSSRKRPSSRKQAGKNKTNTRRARSRTRSPTSTSRSSSQASVRVANPPHPQAPVSVPHPGYGMQLRPPHMHPNPWRNESTPNPSRPPYVLASRPPPPHASGLPVYPGGQSQGRPPIFQKLSPPAVSQALPNHDIRMLIRLYGLTTGEQRVLESVPLTVRNISEAAKTCIRRNQDKSFKPTWQLRAKVRRVKMGDIDYDVSGYAGDDLRPLVESVSKPGVMLEVEVDVHTSEGVPPPSSGPLGPGNGRFYGEGFIMPGMEFREQGKR